jgi:hypothetical protein
MGVAMYFMAKYNMDPALMAILTPMIAAALAVVSKKVPFGEDGASFFGSAAKSE